ncbi:MAG: hypothetical protein ACK4TL_03860 [Hyphomicrobiaceae bacterium]
MVERLSRIFCTRGLLIGLVVMVPAASGPLEAQPFEHQPYEEWRYETRRPKRGYEGFPAPGVYCSYHRVPNRVCTTDKRGRRTCRIKSWTLVQFCS